jgi:polysaccharide export outer membrane protein
MPPRTFNTLVAALVAAGCVFSITSGAAGKALPQETILPPPDGFSSTTQSMEEYRVGVFDTLIIAVLQLDPPEHPDHTVQVSPTGYISLPLAGDFKVAGKTTREIANDIALQLGKRELQDPQVTVMVKDAQSLKFTVEGSVAKPGVYPVSGPMTLLQGLATAQGSDQYADNRHVMLYRQVAGQKREAIYNLNDIRTGKMLDPPIYAQDLIIVPGSSTKRALRDYGALMSLLFFVPHP